jgi:hypothetical protein
LTGSQILVYFDREIANDLHMRLGHWRILVFCS